MAKRKQDKWAKRYWILTEPWTKAFFASHMFGWLVAWLQTIWIIAEIRKKKSK